MRVHLASVAKRVRLSAVACFVALASRAPAQSAISGVSGVVRDTAGLPVGAATTVNESAGVLPRGGDPYQLQLGIRITR